MKNRSEYSKETTKDSLNENVSREGHPYYKLAHKRFSKGKTIGETLEPPSGHGGRRRYYEYDRSKVNPTLNQKTISHRIQRGRSIEDSIGLPLGTRKPKIEKNLLPPY